MALTGALLRLPRGGQESGKGLTGEKDSVCLGGSRMMGLPPAPIPYAGKHRTPSQTWHLADRPVGMWSDGCLRP